MMLTSAETQAVAMVIHELVTNAAKYGALSGPDGRVSVSWDRTGADAATFLTITWRELGGPPIAASVQSGYGTSLIRDLIPHELGGTVELEFPSDGARCEIKIPLEGGAKILLTAAKEDVLNTSVRKLLKRLGITAQHEIEKAVRDAETKRQLSGPALSARAVVTVGSIDLKVEIEIDGNIELA
jgi:hypothetical protein